MTAAVIHTTRWFDGSRLHPAGAVTIADGRIASVGGEPPRGAEAIRLPPGGLLSAGFIDTQVNGGGGVLLNDAPTAEAVARIAAAHRRFGTTAMMPTLISDSREQMRRAADAVAAAIAAKVPGVVGLHLEGPFLNPARKGAHPQSHLVCPEAADLDLLLSIAAEVPLMVTLAPECVPAGFVKKLVAAGIRVSAGHTEGPAEAILAAAEEGLSGVTHLYNAMAQLGSRAPGVVGAALADDRLFAGIIADGHHVSALSLQVAMLAKGAGRLMLVSDAMPPVGTGASEFSLFGQTIRVEGGRCLNPDGVLAGSILDMAGAVRHIISAGASLEDALIMATRTPATFLGLADRGAIAPGMRADLVALDDGLNVIATWIGGEVEWALPRAGTEI